MFRAAKGVRRGLCCGVVGLASILVASALINTPAEARGRHRHHRAAAAESYEPPFASIVVDANTGAVLQQSNADSPRHPASITKIMTLYLLFERLESGKIKMSSPIEMSAHAAAQEPSKLDLDPGETISVETAIKAIVTKSANDVAVAVAETLGGSEEEFARMMTRKARALGMKNTTYHNASGLPDDAQITTVRDQALLGRAIQDRFPQYYRYFSTTMFTFQGHEMRNHNHLLGRIAGIDGIKTGYTRASGFNLVSSVRRNGRHIVAAVFGGRTAGWRDARMQELIDRYIETASAKRTAPPITETAEQPAPAGNAPTAEALPPAPAPAPVAAEPKTTQSIAALATRTERPATAKAMPPVGSTEPIKPHVVKTVAVKAASLNAALPVPNQSATAPAVNVAVTKVEPPKQNEALRNEPIGKSAESTKTEIAPGRNEALPPPPPGSRPGVLGVLPVQIAEAGEGDASPAPRATAPLRTASATPLATPAPTHAKGEWMIQVGALETESEAKQRLEAARGAAKEWLGRAEPFTEKASKGDKTLYRARFAGLDKEQAENACKHLKHSNIACMAIKN
jgi:D-alanyl-D-alanine carboxypeptidase